MCITVITGFQRTTQSTLRLQLLPVRVFPGVNLLGLDTYKYEYEQVQVRPVRAVVNHIISTERKASVLNIYFRTCHPLRKNKSKSRLRQNFQWSRLVYLLISREMVMASYRHRTAGVIVLITTDSSEQRIMDIGSGRTRIGGKSS